MRLYVKIFIKRLPFCCRIWNPVPAAHSTPSRANGQVRQKPIFEHSCHWHFLTTIFTSYSPAMMHCPSRKSAADVFVRDLLQSLLGNTSDAGPFEKKRLLSIIQLV